MANPIPMATETSPPPSFATLFQRAAEAAGTAPGRVNLIGDHTDYNGGYLLAMVLPQGTRVEAAVRNDRVIHVWNGSVDPQQAHGEYRLGQERPRHDWLDSVQAATAVLAREGHGLTGVDMRLVSSLPSGAGLSSRASLLVAVLRALGNTLGLALPDERVARLAQLAVTEFLGRPAGIQDHMVCALGKPGYGFFLDAATLTYEHMPLPRSVEWLVVPSGVRHSHMTDSREERRRECEAACALMGIRSMRDLEGAGRQAVLSRIDELPPPFDARARHVVTENERVLIGLELLEQGNMWGFGSVMQASHASLRHDYEASVPEADLLVDLACAEDAVYGARLTGRGFGGSVIIAAEAGTGGDIAARIAERYRAHSRREAPVLAAG